MRYFGFIYFKALYYLRLAALCVPSLTKGAGMLGRLVNFYWLPACAGLRSGRYQNHQKNSNSFQNKHHLIISHLWFSCHEFTPDVLIQMWHGTTQTFITLTLSGHSFEFDHLNVIQLFIWNKSYFKKFFYFFIFLFILYLSRVITLRLVSLFQVSPDILRAYFIFYIIIS